MWYRRHEAQRRYTFFFSSTALAGAFGGLLASAIGKMDKMRGYRAWRWIFILEGTLTCVVALFFFFLLPDFPERAKWLREDERAYLTARLEADQGKSGVDQKITIRDILRVLRDLKTIVSGFSYLGLIVPAYSYAYFSPGIIQSYKYSPIQTQLHSVPPWAAAFAFAMILAYVSDKTRHRFAFTIIPLAVCLTGFCILRRIHDNLHAQYAALFLVAMGAYSAMPIIVCWYNMNLPGHNRRSIGSAWQICFGNIGGIIAVFSFLQKDYPQYKAGYSICIGFVALSLASCITYFVLCFVSNSRKKTIVESRLTDYERMELGDKALTYRYLL